MGKNKNILLILCLLPTLFFARNKDITKYIVYLKNKPANKSVEQLFSLKASEKRRLNHIAFDERDYPVSTNYLAQIKQNGILVLSQSNWLNAVLVAAEEKSINALQKLDFVASVAKVEKSKKIGIASVEDLNECAEINDTQGFEDTYTSSFAQFNLLNGEYLHEQGFNGENMTIAICDNGFFNANNNPGFSHVFSDNRILGTYDYVHGDSLVYDESAGSHGALCFSFIAGLKNNQYIGTATKANFYLFHSEDNGGERLQEEFNLAIALERCSQLGVDVVSISLGYYTFDLAAENHDTSDMKKNITPAAKAVNIASSKGLLVCVAAGNEGLKPWRYITTPADADSAFSIASVGINGNPSSFSSYGLANDTRVKPNVAAVGQGTNYINTSGTISAGSGTSFATPSIAGMATCLWQAFPAKTNWEIKTAIEQSASQYLMPDKHIGYGIPDFKKAYQSLLLASSVYYQKNEKDFNVFPNPFQNQINITNNVNSVIEQIQLVNNLGQVVFTENSPSTNTIFLNSLPKGMYILQISTNQGQITKKLLKD